MYAHSAALLVVAAWAPPWGCLELVAYLGLRAFLLLRLLCSAEIGPWAASLEASIWERSALRQPALVLHLLRWPPVIIGLRLLASGGAAALLLQLGALLFL